MVEGFNALEYLKKQHSDFITQKEQAIININQLIGAIYACDMMIKKYEEEEFLKEL